MDTSPTVHIYAGFGTYIPNPQQRNCMRAVSVAAAARTKQRLIPKSPLAHSHRVGNREVIENEAKSHNGNEDEIAGGSGIDNQGIRLCLSITLKRPHGHTADILGCHSPGSCCWLIPPSAPLSIGLVTCTEYEERPSLNMIGLVRSFANASSPRRKPRC